jgi:hypothetical protein
MVGVGRLTTRTGFRLRPGGASNKARWGADGAGTVEFVDKRSLFGCDPASSVPEKVFLAELLRAHQNRHPDWRIDGPAANLEN